MQERDYIPLIFSVLALLAGVGVLLARIDPDQLRGWSRTMPGLALFRFRVYRYTAAAVCIVMAGIAAAYWAGLL